MTDAKPYRHRFPMTIIQHAVWLYHRFPLSYRDVQELLHQRGIEVSHETLREWSIKFGPLFADDLRHWEPRRGSQWHLDEVWIPSANSKKRYRIQRFARLKSIHQPMNTERFEFADSIRSVRASMASNIGYGVLSTRWWFKEAVTKRKVI